MADYDFFVIGGGSGGVRAARLAASLGKRVGIAEEYRYGGTCVIRGCVPKKLFVYASQFSEQFEDSARFGWSVENTSFDWPTLIANKDSEIDRLEGLYRTNLEKSGAEVHHCRARLSGPHSIELVGQNKTVTADKILIATGGRPSGRDFVEGGELAITSDEAFHLEQLPRSIVIIGGGYIAVEFANIFHGLGVDTTLVYRGAEILSRFDHDIRQALQEAMIDKGIKVLVNENVTKIAHHDGDKFTAQLKNSGETLLVDQVMLALGRHPYTADLGVETAGIEINSRGAIEVDEYQRTSVPHIFAVGDVTDKVQLTPVAIHEAMCVIETAFHDNPTSPDHDAIATAVFSQPEIGTVGLSEEEAAKKYDSLEIYLAKFRPMRNTISGRGEKMVMKLVVDTQSRKVIGAHILGPDAGEMAQVLGITIKGGLTKDDYDRTMALHPSAAEELVTMYTPSYRIEFGKRVES